MIILNEYSPINLPQMSGVPTSENDKIINSILPARRPIRFYGLWEDIQTQYQPIDYIEADGTQWIDTGITPSKSLGIKIKYRYTTSGATPVAGLLRYASPRTDALLVSTYDGQTNSAIFLAHAGGYCNTGVTAALNTDYTVEINYKGSGKFKLNGTEYGSIGTTDTSTTVTIPIFNRYNVSNSTYSSSNARIYSVEITDGSTTIMSLKPYYNTVDEEVGMLDDISGTFFTNAGTGDFIAETPDYADTHYTTSDIYWTPSSNEESPVRVVVSQPAPAVGSNWIPRRNFLPPENPDMSVDIGADVSLKGFATKETVLAWIYEEPNEYPENKTLTSEFEEYYTRLIDYDSSIAELVEDSSGNFDFERYLETDSFPFEILFECDTDIEIRGAGNSQYIEFNSAVGFDRQDVFAIYERKRYSYNFYYDSENGGGLYTTVSVRYGDIVGNPTHGDGPLPSSDVTTYKLTSSTSGGVKTWSASEYTPTPSEQGIFASKKKGLDSTNPWKIRGTSTIEDMTSHISGPNDVYNYEMNITTTIPVVCVIDGEIETSDSGYGSDSNLDCVGNNGIYDYISDDFKGIVPGQAFQCNLNGFKIYKKNTTIPARDTSFMNTNGGWFLNSNCTQNYVSGSYVFNQNTPVILYQKTTKACGIRFNITSDSTHTFSTGASLLNDCVRVSYNYSTLESPSALLSFELSNPVWAESDLLVVPQGTTLKVRNDNLTYRYVNPNSDEIGVTNEWTEATDNTVRITIPSGSSYNSFTVSDDYTMNPTFSYISKPKVSITMSTDFSLRSDSGASPSNTAINSTRNVFTSNSKRYSAIKTGTDTYEFIYLDANAGSVDTATSFSLSWLEVVDSSSSEDFGGFILNGSGIDIESQSLSAKSGDTLNITMQTSRTLEVSVNNLNFFRKNNSSSQAVDSNTNRTIKVYMDGSSSPTGSKTYTSSSDTNNIVVVGNRITRVEEVDNANAKIAIFNGLSTEPNGTVITLPHALTGNETLYAKWSLPTYTVRVFYDYKNGSSTTLGQTGLTYNPINDDGSTVLNLRSYITTGYDVINFRIVYPNPVETIITKDFDSEVYSSLISASNTLVNYKYYSDSTYQTISPGNTSSFATYNTLRQKGRILSNICLTDIDYYLSARASAIYSAIYSLNQDISYALSSSGLNKKLYHVDSNGNKTRITSGGTAVFNIQEDQYLDNKHLMTFVIE